MKYLEKEEIILKGLSPSNTSTPILPVNKEGTFDKGGQPLY